MNFIDWCIVIVPLLILAIMAIYSKKYTRSIVDYLASGRVAGRYVISVGDLTSALSVIAIVANVEQHYQTGYAVSFWFSITGPVMMILSLTGFFVYRWRQTKCLSLGQFLELRYGSKFFRIFCAALRTLAEMITNAIGPAIATNFFIYYLGLPHRVMICGINLPCYAIIVVMCLALAVLFIWPSGRISLLITDSVQGLFCYPIFVILVGYVLLYFSWFDDIVPVMTNRVEGQSFLNPYDISKLRDFNLFALMVTLTGAILNRGAWVGNDTGSSGRTPHEQKMAGVLGAWRNGLSIMMTLLIAVIVITIMNSGIFADKNNKLKVSNHEIRQELSARVLDEIIVDDNERSRVIADIAQIAPPTADDFAKPMSQQNNLDTPYFNTVRESLGDNPNGRFYTQQFRSLYNQMMMPTLLGKILPHGILGLFCLLMIMLLISTDDSRIFNASSTITQDLILPFFKKHLSFKAHLWLLRGVTVAVALFFVVVSLLFVNMDYIIMFTTIITALWTGGAAPIMLFGLYSRFGNLTGAWCALIFGSGTSLIGLICQRNWAKTIYPFIEKMGWTESVDNILRTITSPFHPWIEWSINPEKFPINSYEIYFISMMLSIGGYIIGSYLTYKPYNLDKLLHRGEYGDGETVIPEKITFRNIFRKIIGITSEYTLGDKVIAWSVFIYSVIYNVLILFVGICIWNYFQPWPNEWWGVKFFITSVTIPCIIGVISTIWFTWGGCRDIKQLFIDLEKRVEDDNDNGQVL